MSAALTPPFAVAALLLCVAGALKLRAPDVSAGALGSLGLPAATWIVRAVAVGEIALGVVCAVHPTLASAAVLTGAYVTFAGVAAALQRRRAACGCFGEDEGPVASAHWMASVALGAVALAACLAGPDGPHGPHGLGWVLGRNVPAAAVLIVGIAGALYATVLVYTQLPAAWTAWTAGTTGTAGTAGTAGMAGSGR